MAEIALLSCSSNWIDLDFVERERTPERAMKLGIQMHITCLSLLNTISILDNLGFQRSRKAVHDRVQKADLQPASGKTLNQIAGDETVIRITDQQFWLYAAANPRTNQILYLRLFWTTKPLSPKYFSKNCGKDTMSKPPYFWSMVRNISELHFDEQAPISDRTPRK